MSENVQKAVADAVSGDPQLGERLRAAKNDKECVDLLSEVGVDVTEEEVADSRDSEVDTPCIAICP